MLQPVPLPVRGVSNARSFIDTPGDLSPYALDEDGKPIMRNILPYTPGSNDRSVLGTRAGFDLLFPQQCGGVGGAPWRELIPVAISSVIDGYTVGTLTQLEEGNSIDSGAIVGNYFQTDSVPSMDGIGALGTGSVNATAVCPVRQGTDAAPYRLCFVSSNTTSGGWGIATIRCYRDDTGATVWTATISETNVNRYVNSMVASDNFLFVCTNDQVRMYRILDGSLVTSSNINGWAQECIKAAVYKNSAGEEYLFVGFNGSAAAGTCIAPESHVIQAGAAATHFRSGVQRFEINNEYVAPIGPYSSDALAAETMGWGQTQNSSGVVSNAGSEFAEADGDGDPIFYGYFRVSEHSRVAGHGCLINSIAVDPRDGSVFVIRTNQGYGPSTSGSDSDGNTFAPDGLEYPAITVFKISFDGRLRGEGDVGSLDSSEVGVEGLANDIPTTATDDPTLSVVAVSPLGMVAVGGRQTEAGYSFFGLDPDTLALQWQIDLMDTGKSLREGAIAVDPGDGAFIVGGDATDTWPDAGGDFAHVWKVNALDGSLGWPMGGFLVDSAVSVLSVSVMDDGSLVISTDYVT